MDTSYLLYPSQYIHLESVQEVNKVRGHTQVSLQFYSTCCMYFLSLRFCTGMTYTQYQNRSKWCGAIYYEIPGKHLKDYLNVKIRHPKTSHQVYKCKFLRRNQELKKSLLVHYLKILLSILSGHVVVLQRCAGRVFCRLKIWTNFNFNWSSDRECVALCDALQ